MLLCKAVPGYALKLYVRVHVQVKVNVKVKQSRYRPGVAQRVAGS
jgi:hypothetical protein